MKAYMSLPSLTNKPHSLHIKIQLLRHNWVKLRARLVWLGNGNGNGYHWGVNHYGVMDCIAIAWLEKQQWVSSEEGWVSDCKEVVNYLLLFPLRVYKNCQAVLIGMISITLFHYLQQHGP